MRWSRKCNHTHTGSSLVNASFQYRVGPPSRWENQDSWKSSHPWTLVQELSSVICLIYIFFPNLQWSRRYEKHRRGIHHVSYQNRCNCRHFPSQQWLGLESHRAVPRKLDFTEQWWFNRGQSSCQVIWRTHPHHSEKGVAHSMQFTRYWRIPQGTFTSPWRGKEILWISNKCNENNRKQTKRSGIL